MFAHYCLVKPVSQVHVRPAMYALLLLVSNWSQNRGCVNLVQKVIQGVIYVLSVCIVEALQKKFVGNVDLYETRFCGRAKNMPAIDLFDSTCIFLCPQVTVLSGK